MKTLNYSLRYLLKNRGNSLTRLVSLALGLIVALLICSYVGINLSYGRFFPDRERVYMMFEKSAQFGISKAMLQPMAPTLAEVIPQIEAATHHFDRLMQLKVGDIPVDYRYLNVGSDFFTVLDFGVISGDPKRILSDEGLANNEVMISERLATTLFGNNAPLGKILTTTSGGEYVIGGVFRTPPVTNPLGDFDVVSYLRFDPATANWNGDDSYPTYIKLRKGATIEDRWPPVTSHPLPLYGQTAPKHGLYSLPAALPARNPTAPCALPRNRSCGSPPSAFWKRTGTLPENGNSYTAHPAAVPPGESIAFRPCPSPPDHAESILYQHKLSAQYQIQLLFYHFIHPFRKFRFDELFAEQFVIARRPQADVAIP